jgi:hypothetical protein
MGYATAVLQQEKNGDHEVSFGRAPEPPGSFNVEKTGRSGFD